MLFNSSIGNYSLNQTVKKAGVKIHNSGYKGLYNKNSRFMHSRKTIVMSEHDTNYLRIDALKSGIDEEEIRL